MGIQIGNDAVVVTHGVGSASNLNVRPTASTDNPAVGQFQRGNVVHIDDGPFTGSGSAAWWHISGGALAGFAAGEFLQDAGPTPLGVKPDEPAAILPSDPSFDPSAPDAPAGPSPLLIGAAALAAIAAAAVAWYVL